MKQQLLHSLLQHGKEKDNTPTKNTIQGLAAAFTDMNQVHIIYSWISFN